jgi:hypothetical protein
MEPYDFLVSLARILDGLQIGYHVTGSMASITFRRRLNLKGAGGNGSDSSRSPGDWNYALLPPRT